MVLGGFRRVFDVVLWRLAVVLGRLPLAPIHYTLMGLLAAVASPLLVFFGQPVLGVFAIALSGFLDAVDGAVARVLGAESRRGALVDSVSDRLSDSMYLLALLGLGVSAVPLLLFMTFAFLTPYLRARGESLGLRMSGVGLMERQERVVFILAVALVSLSRPVEAGYLMWLGVLAGGITSLERFMSVYENA